MAEPSFAQRVRASCFDRMAMLALEMPYSEKQGEAGASQSEEMGMLLHQHEAMGMPCAKLRPEAVTVQPEEMRMP